MTLTEKDIAALEQEIADAQAELDDLEQENEGRIDTLKIEGLVVLKIIKHCKQGLPDLVTGQLLGVGFDNVLEITNCFPFPRTEEESNDSGANYQVDMMKSLREVNADNNTVGWYHSTYLGSCLNESLIESQFSYQTTIKKSVVLIYDPLQSATQGILALKAFRLTDSFMKLYSTKGFSQKSLEQARLSFNDIFDEIQIEISNSSLISAYLWDIESNKALTQSQLKGLDLSSNFVLEKNLESAIEYVEELNAEQNKLQNYHRLLSKQQSLLQKRRAENNARRANGEPDLPEDDLQKIVGPPPSRLDYMLTTNQIDSFCNQINRFAGQSLTKLYLFKGLSEPAN